MLQMLARKVLDAAERSFLNEAITCIEHQASRAAIVLIKQLTRMKKLFRFYRLPRCFVDRWRSVVYVRLDAHCDPRRNVPWPHTNNHHRFTTATAIH
jgi:hypothetical protein